MGLCVLGWLLWAALTLALGSRAAMWSHVIVPLVPPPPPGFRLYWTNQFTRRLGAEARLADTPISPAGYVNPGLDTSAWLWSDVGGAYGTSANGTPYCGQTFVDNVGRIWLYGLLTWDGHATPDNGRFWAAQWDSTAKQMRRAWQVSQPLATSLFGATESYGGIVGMCQIADGTLYAVVQSPTTLGGAQSVNSGVIVRPNTETATAASAQDASTRGLWNRAAVIAGDVYNAHTLIAQADWDGETTPVLQGRIVNIIDQMEEVGPTENVYGLLPAIITWYTDTDTFQVVALALVRCGAGGAHDAPSWDSLIRTFSRYDLADVSATNFDQSFGPVRRSYYQMLHHAGRIWWTWDLAWDSATGNTPHDLTVVWYRNPDVIGAIVPSFTLPIAAGGNSCHWGGLLAVLGDDLWLATFEGGGLSGSAVGTLRMWRWDVTEFGEGWTNTIFWTRAIGAWDGLTVSTMALAPDGTIHLLMDPGDNGAPLRTIEEIIYDPSLPPPLLGFPDLRMTFTTRPAPTGTYTGNYARRFIEWEE